VFLVILFSLLGSVGAVSGAALLLAFPDALLKRLLPCLLSYATGTLLGAAFLGMIPMGLERAPALAISGTVLAGLVVFFILEKLVIWRHCHDENCEAHSHRGGTLILAGDAFHNFVDGVVIAAAFLSAVPLGIATALAVIAHEIPQELGDFAILLHGGMSRRRAFAYNLLSSLTTLPGAVIGWFWLAEADLVPGLHRHASLKSSLTQVILILAGIATIAFFRLGH
jgi:zinc and cadmium transporter